MTAADAPRYSSSPPGLTDKVGRLLTALGRFPLPLILLFLRVGVGGTFFKSGLNKIESWDTAVLLFAEEYKLPLLPPEFAATLATAAELICPAMLVLGLGARLGAAALLAMTIVIQVFVYPANWVEHLLWASALLYILTRGAGTLSLDAIVARSLHR